MAYEGSEKLPGSDGSARRESGYLFIDVAGFVALAHSCLGKAHRAFKRMQIRKILNDFDWVVHYEDINTGRRVLSEGALYYKHEKETAVYLAQFGYDVIFAPEGIFRRADKKFDIFLLRDGIILKADLKSISTKNPDNIARRIKEGSDQASRLVINIVSDIKQKALIDGLRSGVKRNKLITEILLIYKGKLHKLSKAAILNKRFTIT